MSNNVHLLFKHHIKDAKEAMAEGKVQCARDLLAEARKYAQQAYPTKWAQDGLSEIAWLSTQLPKSRENPRHVGRILPPKKRPVAHASLRGGILRASDKYGVVHTLNLKRVAESMFAPDARNMGKSTSDGGSFTTWIEPQHQAAATDAYSRVEKFLANMTTERLIEIARALGVDTHTHSDRRSDIHYTVFMYLYKKMVPEVRVPPRQNPRFGDTVSARQQELKHLSREMKLLVKMRNWPRADLTEVNQRISQVRAAMQAHQNAIKRLRTKGRKNPTWDGTRWSDRDHPKPDLLLEYGAHPNARPGHGYVPGIWRNGTIAFSTYQATGGSAHEAKAAAKLQATQLAERYVGDWNVVVRPRVQRSNPASMHSPPPGMEPADMSLEQLKYTRDQLQADRKLLDTSRQMGEPWRPVDDAWAQDFREVSDELRRRQQRTNTRKLAVTDRGRRGRGPFTLPTIKPGHLGGPGYTRKPAATRHRILAAAVRAEGYRSALGKIMILERYGARTMAPETQAVLAADRAWLRSKFGGPGSFGG